MPDHPPADPQPNPAVAVTKLGYDTASRLFADSIIGLRAETIDTTGTAIYWSQLPGEDFWAADALFYEGHYSAFINSYGARYLRPQIATPQVATALDTAVADAGLTLAVDAGDSATNPPSSQSPVEDPR